jgi:hypothetical protein
MIIEMFAIRNIHTGHYLPGLTGSSGRGGTWSEPVAPSSDLKKLPRLHKNRKVAGSVLTYWLKGKHVCNRDIDGDEEYRLYPQPHRKREDMEIVAITVELP